MTHIELSETQQLALDELHIKCYDAVEAHGGIFSLGENLRPEINEVITTASNLNIPEAFVIEVLNRFQSYK